MNQRINHSKLAGELFEQGYNCAQSVLLAFGDITGLEREMAARMASSFGGGLGGLGEACGALTGALMVLGLVAGNTDPADKPAKELHRRRSFEYAVLFEAEHGSLRCRELLALPEAEAGYGLTQIDKTRSKLDESPCPGLVMRAAQLLAEFLTAI